MASVILIATALLLGASGCSFDGSATLPPWDILDDAGADSGLPGDAGLIEPTDTPVPEDGGDPGPDGVSDTSEGLDAVDGGEPSDIEDTSSPGDALDPGDISDAADVTDIGDVADTDGPDAGVDAGDAHDGDTNGGDADAGDGDAGDADPGCHLPTIDGVYVAHACLTAGSGARSAIVVEAAGQAYLSISMRTSAGETLTVTPTGNSYYAYLDAPAAGAADSITVSISAQDSCGVQGEIAATTIEVEPPFSGDGAGAGGCAVDGNMRVKVVEPDGLTPVEDAYVMLGQSQVNNAYQNSLGSTANNANTGRTDAQGYVEFLDFSGSLNGATTVTAGAPGYAYSTLVEVNASDIVLQLEPIQPALPSESVSGKMTGMPSASQSQVSAGLMFDQMHIEQLMDFRLDTILSKNVCYDSNFFIPDFPIADNIYIPGQWVGPFQLNQKKFTSPPLTYGDHNLLGIGGRLDSSIVQNGSILDMLEAFDFRKIGVRSETVGASSAQGNKNIGLTQALTGNVSCAGSGAPAQSTVFCMMMGDWDSAAAPEVSLGEGRLFLMGLGIDPNVGNAGAYNLSGITTVAASGPFAQIEYLAVSIANYFEAGSAPDPALANGVSVIAKRDLAWSPGGGNFVFGAYLPLEKLTRQDQTFRSVSSAASVGGIADLRRTLIRQRIDRVYTVCGEQKVRTRYQPLWTVYAAGATRVFTLPTLPAGWPRAAEQGLIDPATTPQNDGLEWSQSAVKLGLYPGFDYDAVDLSLIPARLTHVSTNTAAF